MRRRRRRRSVGVGVGAALLLPAAAQDSPHVRQTEAPVNLKMTGSVLIFNILCLSSVHHKTTAKFSVFAKLIIKLSFVVSQISSVHV